MKPAYRADLPDLPERMRSLPLDQRGYPIPWFVHIDEKGPDFRVVKRGAVTGAYRGGTCWLCGYKLGVYKTFVIGPMCGMNRVTSEPPCHRECALYAAQACPFLTRPLAVRNARDMPEGHVPPAGEGIMRNPGVTLVWT